MVIRMVGGWVFLLVPAHPGRQRAVKWLLCVLLSQSHWTSEWFLLLLDCLGSYCSEFSDGSLRAVLSGMEAQPVPLLGERSGDWRLSEWSVCQSVGHSGAAELGQWACQDWLYAVFLYIFAEGVACHLHLCSGRRVQEDCHLAQW